MLVSFLLGLFLTAKMLSAGSGFISENPSNLLAQKFLIPFAGASVKDEVLLVFTFLFIMSIIFATGELSNTKERTLFALLPLHYSDIVFAKLWIVTKKILLIAFSITIPFIVGYGVKTLSLLKPLLFPARFASIVSVYIATSAFYIAFISIIVVVLSFILIIALEFVPSISKYLSFSLNTFLVNIIIAGIISIFAFTIWNSLLISSNSYSEKIYGRPPISYISRAIVNITRPEPHILYSIKVDLLLIIAVFVVLIVTFTLSYFFGKTYWACTQTHKAAKNLAAHKPREFSVIRNLPIFIKRDMFTFLRKGDTFRWLITSFVWTIVVPLIFYLPPILNKEVSLKFTLDIFGIKINYLGSFFLIVSLVQLSQMALYIFYSDPNDIWLLKLTPVNVERFLIGKVVSAMILSLIPFSFITGLVFSLLAHANRPYYLFTAVIQIFVLFMWDFIENFYIGGVKISVEKKTFWQLKSGSLNTYITIFAILSLLIWFVIYKIIFVSPHSLAICITVLELLLPIVLLKKILNRIKSAIEKVDLCRTS